MSEALKLEAGTPEVSAPRRGHVIDGLTNLVPVILKNASGQTLAPYSLVEIVSNSTVNTTDDGLIGTDIALSVQLVQTDKEENVVSTGAIAIPVGKSGPGYVGSILPLRTTAAVGQRISTKKDDTQAVQDSNGFMIVYAKSGAVSLAKHAGSSSGNGVAPPRIRFTTTAKIVDRAVAANVLWNQGSQAAVNDSVTVYDPRNLFAEIETDATGWAVWRTPEVGDPSGTVARWEIEHCSLPANLMRVQIQACLKASDATKDGYYDEVNGGKILSAYPNCDPPPELTEVSTEKFITFSNPSCLHAIKDSFVIIRRISNKIFSEYQNILAPSPFSSTSEEWEVVRVEEPVARWAEFTKSAVSPGVCGQWNLTAHYDGSDPLECWANPNVPLAFNGDWDCSCLEVGQKIYAFYDPKGDTYRAASSASAILGEPDETDLITKFEKSATCAFEITKRTFKTFSCGNEDQTPPETLTISSQLVDVVVGAGIVNGDLVLYRSALFVCDTATATDITLDGEPCPVPCTGEATYTWNSSTAEWDLTTPCANGCTEAGPPTDSGTPNETRTFPCEGLESGE